MRSDRHVPQHSPGSPKIPVSDPSTGKNTDRELVSLVAVWNRLPEKDKRAILEIARRSTGALKPIATHPQLAGNAEKA